MVQKTLLGEREEAGKCENGEKLLLNAAMLDFPHLKTQLGWTGARSAAVAWCGEEGKVGFERRGDKDKAKTGHRLTVYCFLC